MLLFLLLTGDYIGGSYYSVVVSYCKFILDGLTPWPGLIDYLIEALLFYY